MRLVGKVAEWWLSKLWIVTATRHSSLTRRDDNGNVSNFPNVEKEHLNARVIGRKKPAICASHLSLWACKRPFDRREIVEIQGSDPMNR